MKQATQMKYATQSSVSSKSKTGRDAFLFEIAVGNEYLTVFFLCHYIPQNFWAVSKMSGDGESFFHQLSNHL